LILGVVQELCVDCGCVYEAQIKKGKKAISPPPFKLNTTTMNIVAIQMYGKKSITQQKREHFCSLSFWF
jgi:hypothetical protein